MTSPRLDEALARHYAEHGLPPDGGEHQPFFTVRIGPIRLRLPNPPSRRRAVFLHDTNHVLTGYNTVFSDGEMVIAAFEVGSGCGSYGIAWLINLVMLALALVVCPRRAFLGFVRGRRAASIYRRPEDRATLSAFPVDRLRGLIGLDRVPAHPTVRDRLGFAAWGIAGLALVLAPLAAVVVVALTLSRLMF